MKTLLNRRQWLKAAAATAATAVVANRLPLHAQAPGPGAAPTPSVVPPQSLAPVVLSWNENPFGPSPAAREAMQSAVGRSCRYPDPQIGALREELAQREGVPAAQLLLGCGSGEILEAAGLHYGAGGGEIVAADPTFYQLLAAAERGGGRIVRVPLNARLEHDLPALEAAVTGRTRLIYVVNPHNPTGTICAPGALRPWVKRVSARVPVLVDEAYLECLDEPAAHTCAGLVREGHNVIIARTFSKIHGLAGARLGYALMSAPTAEALRARMTGDLSLATVEGGLAALRDEGFVAATRTELRAGREALQALARELGCEHTDAHGNFALIRTGMPAKDFQSKMAAEGVLVGRPFPPLHDWSRITIGLPEEMARCHAALRKVMAGRGRRDPRAGS
jgi:histidinol-phosphate aminotransferase